MVKKHNTWFFISFCVCWNNDKNELLNNYCARFYFRKRNKTLWNRRFTEFSSCLIYSQNHYLRINTRVVDFFGCFKISHQKMSRNSSLRSISRKRLRSQMKLFVPIFNLIEHKALIFHFSSRKIQTCILNRILKKCKSI